MLGLGLGLGLGLAVDMWIKFWLGLGLGFWLVLGLGSGLGWEARHHVADPFGVAFVDGQHHFPAGPHVLGETGKPDPPAAV